MLAWPDRLVYGSDLANVCIREFAPFVAEDASHWHPRLGGIDELHLAPPAFLLAIGQDPDVRGDARIIEKLFGQGDDRLQPIILQNPASDLALAAPGIS